jgi:hypothetical protein
MNEVHMMIGAKVIYDGDNREYLRDRIGVVEKVSDSGAFGVRYEDGSLEWAASWAWKGPVASLKAMDEFENTFSTAAGGERARLINEMERTAQRLADLRKALEVIDSL